MEWLVIAHFGKLTKIRTNFYILDPQSHINLTFMLPINLTFWTPHQLDILAPQSIWQFRPHINLTFLPPINMTFWTPYKFDILTKLLWRFYMVIRLFFVYLFKDFVATSFAASFFPKLWTLEKIGNGKRFELLLFAFVHQVLHALQLMVVHKTKTEKRGRNHKLFHTHKSLKNLAQNNSYGLFYLETHRYFMFMSDPVCSPTSFFFSWQKSHSGASCPFIQKVQFYLK